jgi:hypothetical protein
MMNGLRSRNPRDAAAAVPVAEENAAIGVQEINLNLISKGGTLKQSLRSLGVFSIIRQPPPCSEDSARRCHPIFL